ncbi:MAG: type II toxin-antitoxin system HicA family toxin [Candidatus Tagabacteria bacterium]
MPRVIPLSWKKFEKFLLFVGCSFKRQEGDHRIYWRKNLKRPVVIPKDNELPVFIIRNNLRILNILPKEYLDILENL